MSNDIPKPPNKRRSTFSLTNALRFKRIFDTAVRDGKDLYIPVKGSISAFHTKCSDALKWLIVYQDKEHTDTVGLLHKENSYASLKNRMRFKEITDVKDGNKPKIKIAFFANQEATEEYVAEVVIQPTKEECLLQQAEESKLTGNQPDAWKKELISVFLEGEKYKQGAIFKLTRLTLSEEDQQWAINLLSQVENCVFDVDTNCIIARIGK